MKQKCEFHIIFEFEDCDADCVSDAQHEAIFCLQNILGDRCFDEQNTELIKFDIL
jgi:hypothetical protein